MVYVVPFCIVGSGTVVARHEGQGRGASRAVWECDKLSCVAFFHHGARWNRDGKMSPVRRLGQTMSAVAALVRVIQIPCFLFVLGKMLR